MPATDELSVYLNDHLAGAAAGVDLIHRISDQVDGALDDIAADIEADEKFLEELIKSLGIREHTVKQAMSSVIEKLGQLKMNRVVAGSKELALLLEMEAMAMGIRGKRCLWEALQAAAPIAALAGTDFDAMLQRADNQQARLAEHRLGVAAAALSGTGTPA